jgi:ribose-phosphate pyrophosphokinase
LDYLRRFPLDDAVIVSPDVGGVARARSYAKKLNDVPIAIIDKRRSQHNVAEVMSVVGDVEGKVAIMVDDIIDTAGTICTGAELLKKEGARSIYAVASHAVLSGPANKRLDESPVEQVILTNSIPQDPEKISSKIVQVSVAGLLGEAIARIHDDCSVSELFQ